MNITPDQADQWAKTATDGPWYVETDPDDPYGPFIYDDTGNMCISVEPVGSDYREADLHLAAAAPDLAHTIAGMTEEWGVERGPTGTTLYPVREDEHPMGAYFTPDRAEAEGVRDRMAKLNPSNRYRLVRRLVGPVEEAE